jgi:hypothetical protein
MSWYIDLDIAKFLSLKVDVKADLSLVIYLSTSSLFQITLLLSRPFLVYENVCFILRPLFNCANNSSVYPGSLKTEEMGILILFDTAFAFNAQQVAISWLDPYECFHDSVTLVMIDCA